MLAFKSKRKVPLPVILFTVTSALIELLIVVGIIGILVTLLMPSLGKARKQAHIAVCLSNQHQLGVGINMLVRDNNGSYPRIANWAGLVGDDLHFAVATLKKIVFDGRVGIRQ